MNIARLDSDVTLLVDEGMLTPELIDQAVDLAIELGSCQTLSVIVSVDDAKSDVFGSRWKKVSKTKMRLAIRRAAPPEEIVDRPKKVARTRKR
jgi:hypothetical protein